MSKKQSNPRPEDIRAVKPPPPPPPPKMRIFEKAEKDEDIMENNNDPN